MKDLESQESSVAFNEVYCVPSKPLDTRRKQVRAKANIRCLHSGVSVVMMLHRLISSSLMFFSDVMLVSWPGSTAVEWM